MYPTDPPTNARERRKTDTLQKHMDDRFDVLEKLIKSGFPEGDPEEHRKVHEGYIKGPLEREHCRKSYESERLGKQLPDEYRTTKDAA